MQFIEQVEFAVRKQDYDKFKDLLGQNEVEIEDSKATKSLKYAKVEYSHNGIVQIVANENNIKLYSFELVE